MPIIVLYIMLFFILVLFFLIMPYFISLSAMVKVFVIFLTAFCSCGLGYWLAELTHRWKNKMRLRQLRHDKRFAWYYSMGLLESACLIEPKTAKNHWRYHLQGMGK